MDFQTCGNIATDSLMLLFTNYKCTWITAISSHCLAALPDKKSAFNSTVTCKLPLTRSEPLKICCYVIVTQ